MQAAVTRCPLSKASAARALLRLDMPFGEVRAVLDANDPAVVRRFLELHRERLEERVADQLRQLASIEWSLTTSLPADERRPRRRAV